MAHLPVYEQRFCAKALVLIFLLLGCQCNLIVPKPKP